MRLLLSLIGRVVLVTALGLVAVIAWVLVDAQRSTQADARASAERIVRALQNHVWLGSASAGYKLASPAWETRGTLGVIAPGICVTFTPAQGSEHRPLCSSWSNVGGLAPPWFQGFYDRTFGPSLPVSRPLVVQRRAAGTVVATPLPEAAMQQAWRQAQLVAVVACATVLGMSFLIFLVVGHALLPAFTIIRGLKAIGGGDLDARLPHFHAVEFRLIAEAVNDLADRIAAMMAEQTRLTQLLFQVQEEERRTLARDLHDEFGQCLTATGALAAAIEAGAGAGRPDLAQDARAILQHTARMMTTLKGALARLRPPDLDEFGLEVSLRQLVARWNTQGEPRAAYRLDVEGELASVPAGTALNLYRIVQECMTNAVRHGRPSAVRVRLARAEADGALSLTVEDDGGGDPAAIARAPGFGILGIRERVAALGGRLNIGPAERGVRVQALIPVPS